MEFVICVAAEVIMCFRQSVFVPVLRSSSQSVLHVHLVCETSSSRRARLSAPHLPIPARLSAGRKRDGKSADEKVSLIKPLEHPLPRERTGPYVILSGSARSRS